MPPRTTTDDLASDRYSRFLNPRCRDRMPAKDLIDQRRLDGGPCRHSNMAEERVSAEERAYRGLCRCRPHERSQERYERVHVGNQHVGDALERWQVLDEQPPDKSDPNHVR